MKKQEFILSLLLAVPAAGLFASCAGNTSESPYPAVVDEEFTKFYNRDSGGVTSSDGTISILLDDGSSVFMTGDCFIGDVVDGKRNHEEQMLHNSLIHISADGKHLGSILGGTPDAPNTLCVPMEADTAKCAYWYWPGHGYQEGSKLFLYMTKFYQGGEGQWGFRYDGVDVVTINMNDWSVESIEEVYDEKCPVHWGNCVMEDDGYYYIYGTRSGDRNPAELCVSRAKFDENAGKMGQPEYFDGKAWSADSTAAVGCEGLDVSVSEQFSVFRYKNKYVLLTQRRAQQAGDIYSYIADSPTGPWYNKKLLYETHEQVEKTWLFTYNAMAHPQFTNDKNELLICYNINSYDTTSIYDDVNEYRPVFLRVPMKVILKK